MKNNAIKIKGAKEHNLKNIDLTIPRDKFVVFTGISGSGKSTLAFDTIYAEGQRRYVESLSSYARKFLGQMEKPDVDSIEGLSPAIAIDQKTASRNPRSTVGTITEVYDYLRLFYARIGVPHCPKCGKVISHQSVDQMVDRVMNLSEGTKIQILAPVIKNKKGKHQKVFEQAQKNGYIRAKIDGNMYDFVEDIDLDKNKEHSIEIVIDRLIVRDGIEKRLAESIEMALKEAKGTVIINQIDGDDIRLSESLACLDCNISVDDIEPRLFSFNNPFGACEECHGLGYEMKFEVDLIVQNPKLSILGGAIVAPGWTAVTSQGSHVRSVFDALSKRYGIDLDKPYEDLSDEVKDIIMYGSNDEKIDVYYKNEKGEGKYSAVFDGIVNNLYRRYKETPSESAKQEFEDFMAKDVCSTCKGARLNPTALAVTIGDKNIAQVTQMPIKKVKAYFDYLNLTKREKIIGKQILRELRARINFLLDVGLDYLSLSRAANTLSGGEAQRIRLATQIGSGLMGVTYILDEPSIGLHQRDNEKLIMTLKKLKDLGNTLIVVEHDEDTINEAEYIVDIGPKAGVNGGEIVAQGTLEDIIKSEKSLTGGYLSGREKIAIPKKRRATNDKWLHISGARANNLKNISVDIPLGVFTSVTGVSGSGKSSLINEILYKQLAKELNRGQTHAGQFDGITGVEHLDKVIEIDQSPIGRTPRSNPATYTGVFDEIREIFTNTVEAKMRGYKKGRFSFNVKGGRCEACKGDGTLKIEMHFLPDVYVPCEVCNGNRYNRETLEVAYKGKTIAEVLDMTIEEALRFFSNIPKIKRKLQTLYDVGLSYIKLGQPSTTLSGGEAQRIKLATELSKMSTGKTMYILDEPTTGLHFEDIRKLIVIIQRLVNTGNSVLVIEHNLDVIKTADYVIDLGPEGGDDGGLIVATGTPEDIVKCKTSYTGRFLTKVLQGDSRK